MNEPESSTTHSGRRLGTLAGAAIAATILLASGCSDSDEDSTSSGTTGGNAIVTGSAECDRTSIEEAVANWEKAFGDGGTATLPDTSGSFRCVDGWAVAFPDVGSGETAVTVTAVFEAEGQFWIPKDRDGVCGETAADSQVPESLYRDACQTN